MTRSKEAEVTRAERAEIIKQWEAKRDEYVKRLDDGAIKIEEARRLGKDVTSWEDYWIQLLRMYEAVCEKVRDLQAQQAEG